VTYLDAFLEIRSANIGAEGRLRLSKKRDVSRG